MGWPGAGSPAWVALAIGTLFLADRAPAQSFSLASEKKAYLLGEPVYLRIESSEAALPPALEEGAVVLAVSGPDGVWDYRPPLQLRSRPDPRKAPGGSGPDPLASRIRYARLIAREGGLVFHTPGRYQVRLCEPMPGHAALSPALEFRVRAPTSPADKRAFALISRNPGEFALAVYLEGGGQLREGMAILQELSTFPNAYRSLAAFVLSSDWSQEYRDFRSGTVRAPDLEKALAFAQLRPEQGYIALKNAYRLNQALDQASQPPGSAGTTPGAEKIRQRLGRFFAALSPAAWAGYRSLEAPRTPFPD